MNKLFIFVLILALQFAGSSIFAQETEETLAYCTEEMQAKGFGSSKDINIEVGIYLPQITTYAGNDISKVRIGLKKKVSNLKIFIRESLEEEPVYTQIIGTVNEGWNDIVLDERFAITDKPVYVGYSCSLKGGSYEIGISSDEPCENSFYMNTGSGFSDMSKKEYSPLSFMVVIAGTNFTYDTAGIKYVDHTYVKPDEQVPVILDIENAGMNEITSVEAEISIVGTDQVLPLKLDNISIARKSTLEGNKVTFEALPEGVYDINCKILKVNGKEQGSDEKFTQRVYVLSESMEKIPVCEKITGNNCQFCPRGIVAFEQMFEEYPDKFIGISADCYSDMDPLFIRDYTPLLTDFSGSAPSFVIDRKWVSREIEEVKRDYKEACQQLAWAELAVSAPLDTYKDGNLDVTVQTTFGIDQSETHYRLILVAIENGVKSFQINGYSGNFYGEMGGWENLPTQVDTTFNEVARRIIKYDGIENSVPTSVVKGEKCEFEYTMDIPQVGDIHNAEIVAMLLNTENGQIVNSAKVKVDPNSGIQNENCCGTSFVYSTQDGTVYIRFGEKSERNISFYSIDGQKICETSCDDISATVHLPVEHGICIMVVREHGIVSGKTKILL